MSPATRRTNRRPGEAISSHLKHETRAGSAAASESGSPTSRLLTSEEPRTQDEMIGEHRRIGPLEVSGSQEVTREVGGLDEEYKV